MRNTNNYLSVSDIGRILEVSREVVNTWLRKNYMRYARVGHLRKVRTGELIKYLEGLGNSKTAMANFERDIRDYIREKQEAKR
ncbi:hypothetical protein ES702_07509 [subsurface metagenome]